MPRTHIRTLYKFDELSEDAKAKAIDTIREDADWCWGEHDNVMLTETFADRLAEQGYPTEDIEWSLSGRQGDGVAFYGSIDIETWLRANKRMSKYRSLGRVVPCATITRNSYGYHYSHAHTMDVEVAADDYERLTPARERLLEDLSDELREAVIAMSHELESIGEADIAAHSSDEYIIDMVTVNEVDFIYDGTVA